MTNSREVGFLNSIDELSVALLGPRETADLAVELPGYRELVYQSYAADQPLAPPRYSLMKVTNRCNSGCAYCNHSIYADSKLDQTEAPTVLLKQILTDLAELGVRSVNFSGGEPLMRADIAELVSHAVSQQMLPILLTNGLLLPKEWKSLGEAGLRFIIMSIDSLNPDIFERQRGVPLEHVWRGFEAALRMRDRYHPVAVHVTCVVTRENLAELLELTARFASYGVSLQFSPYHHFDGSVPDVCTPKDPQEVDRVLGELVALKQAGHLIANSDLYLEHFRAFFAGSRPLPPWFQCYAGYVGVFIDALLNVRPCWSWSLPIVGNLYRDRLQDVWNSEYFNQQRAEIRQLHCSRCWLLCTAELSIRFMEEGRA